MFFSFWVGLALEGRVPFLREGSVQISGSSRREDVKIMDKSREKIIGGRRGGEVGEG